MAARGKWRTRGCRISAVLFSILIQVVNGYEQTYTISQLSPKSLNNEELILDEGLLQTTQTENLAFRIEPSANYNLDFNIDSEDVKHEEGESYIRVARSADPNDRESRSINIEEIPTSNHNEIDSELELHNKRKYYEILPTKTLQIYHDRNNEEIIMSSEGYGDKLSFTFPGEAKRVPKGRALAPAGPKIRPTAVQPIFATVGLREQGRQNSEIQNIITGIVKLLNGNVNVQANTQLLNGGRPGRPMASRINNRGPPKISDVPPLPDLDPVITPPAFAFHPTKTPPPYPFDRPPYHGVNLPEQIVPPVSQHRPSFHRPIPPWQRPRPRPPNRRPLPNLQIYKPTPPPPPIDIPNYDEPLPEGGVNENETSHSENHIHHDDHDVPVVLTMPNQSQSSTPEHQDESPPTTPDTASTSTTTITTEAASTTKTTTTSEKPTEPPTEKPTEPPTEPPTRPPTKPPTATAEKHELPANKPDKEKKKESHIDKEKLNKEKNRVVEDKPKKDEAIKNTTSTPVQLQPSIFESSTSTTTSSPTPTDGLISHAPPPSDSPSVNGVIKTSAINSQPLPSSQGIPYHPYRPRPGIVLDDTDFKPHANRYRPEASVITAAPEPQLPGYGEIFDVTVSAIQGPGEKGGASVHIENVHAPGSSDNEDIIVSAAGTQGFVSIDGKRTYLNLFDTSTTSVQPTQVQTAPHHSSPPPHKPLGPGIGTGVAVPADDVQVPPARRPQPTHQLQTRPHQPYRRPQPTVRIDTCIVGDDSTCDQAQNEKCRTEAGISSCQCRPGYARRNHRDPCRRVVAFLLNLRVERLYDRKIVWDNKLADKESEPYLQLSYEAIRAIDSAFSMTPFSDDFVGGSVNSIHKGDAQNQGVFVNYTILMQESAGAIGGSSGAELRRQLVGVLRRRADNVGASALWVKTPEDSVLPLADLDECSSPDLNDCHQLASCTNTWGGFKCACPDTALDAGGAAPAGRLCRACAASHCSERGQCRYAAGQPYCSCSSGYYGSTCEVDGEVVGVAVGASLAAALVIALTLAALLSWSRKWSREQKAAGMGSPVFSYMAANTVKTPPVGQPPYQVSIEERMRWAQIAEAMAQANHYAQPDPAQMTTRPSSAMFGGYPTLPPMPLPRFDQHTMGVHHPGGHHNGTMNTVASRANTVASHLNLYGYGGHAESSGSEASSRAADRSDLLVPRPRSRAPQHNQTGIYYDVEYENAPEPIYGSKGIPLSTYTVSRGPTFYRA